MKVSPWYRPAEFKYGGSLLLATRDANSAWSKMLAMIPHGSRVLETGCANGRFSRVLVEHGCRVVGVELDSGAAAEARVVCEQVIVGDLEDPDVRKQIPGSFDVILFGDVLEHLVRPWQVLSDLRANLSIGGSVVVSIPNIAHWDTRMNLLRGRFNYEDQGLLDGTHLRFFTHRTARELLEQTGYRVVKESRVGRVPAWVYSVRLVRRFAPALLLPLLIRLAPNLFTWQIVMKAVPR
jgi:methionine biosynthesis protein MetW